MSGFEKELAWIDGQKQPLIEEVKRWSAVNSGSHNLDGIRQFAEMAKEAFSTFRLKLRFWKLSRARKVNAKGDLVDHPYGPVVRISKNTNANRKVLLTGHMDTVFPKDSHFQTTPKCLMTIL